MSSPSRSSVSDDVNGAKWDRCLTDAIIKTALGFAWGAVFSAVLFKRRPWPLFMGTGIGLGIGYNNCQHDLRLLYMHTRSVPVVRVEQETSTMPSESQ